MPRTNAAIAESVRSRWSRCGLWPHRSRMQRRTGPPHCRSIASTWRREPYGSSIPCATSTGTVTAGRRSSMFQARKPGSSQARFHPQKAQSTFPPWYRSSLRPQVRVEVFVARLLDGAHGDLLAEDVRRLEQQAADPGQGPRRRSVQKGDGAAVAVPDEKGPADARRVEKLRKGEEPLVVHVGERSRKRDGIGAAVSGAAVDERAAPRHVGERRGKVPPRRGASDAVVQEDEGGSDVRLGAMPGELDAAAARENCRQRSSPLCRVEGCRAYVL